MGKGSGCICYAKGSQSQTDISQASLRWLSRRECLCREKKTLFSEFLFNSNTETNRWRKTWFCKNVCITSWAIEWLSGVFSGVFFALSSTSLVPSLVVVCPWTELIWLDILAKSQFGRRVANFCRVHELNRLKEREMWAGRSREKNRWTQALTVSVRI